ncbi:uncharacterized protein C8A04DRAFT_15451 [Dichotomopilus funicola]|uniref:Uncharacterized protein n=1 Tax=Dichotomopilus funicola TaxID=1934379 RepID=A0AAN6UVK6_9PEZI|nr:hypothetical protein C8A04DRAFT_15451 [Dichotomopilus funicola]
MVRSIEDQTPQPPALLRLPPHLRYRIYLYVGIARHDGHPNTYYLDGRKESPGYTSVFDEPPMPGCTSGFNPPPTRNFTGLLLCCYGLYTEVAALLYSTNQFVIHAGKASLQPLKALSPTAIASLRSLKIILNECSCHYPVDSKDYPPPCCCNDVEHEPVPHSTRSSCAEYHKDLHRPPLLDPVPPNLDFTSSKLAAQALLADWNDAAVHLSSHVRPGCLELSLEVTWCRRYPHCYQVCRPPCDPDGRGPPCQPHIHHGCRLSQCIGVDPDSELSGVQPRGPGCFCRRRHAAFSFTCNCWAPPTSLFFVCRTFCHDAQVVFFSRNRFIIHDVQAWPFQSMHYTVHEQQDPETVIIQESYPHERLAVSQFLREFVPTNCLAHLRFLELVFPPYQPPCWPVDGHPAQVNWRDTVDWLRGKIDAPALTIRVAFADFLYNPAGARAGTTKDEGVQIVRGYMHIIRPLEPLLKHDGLAALYVQPAYPWAWRRDVLPQELKPTDKWARGLASQKQQIKDRLERIPGCEAIVDSRNKPEPRISGWANWYNVKWFYH